MRSNLIKSKMGWKRFGIKSALRQEQGGFSSREKAYLSGLAAVGAFEASLRGAR